MELLFAVASSGAFAAAVSGIVAYLAERRARDDAVMLLLYHDIKQECRDYLAQGSIDADGLEVLTKMHDVYHKKGGNGYLDKLMSAVSSLPLETERRGTYE